MKNKKKMIILAAIVTFTVITAVILGVSLYPNKAVPADTDKTTDSGKIADISVEVPEKDSEISDNATYDKLPDGAVIVIPKETENDTQCTENTGEKPTPAQKPVTPNPSPEGNENSSGAAINGGEHTTAYKCGTKGHRCEAPETHAYILNLELKGCEYCGSHSCPSFYSSDEWGNACYTPSKCPKYNIKNDPAYYCQTCKKKCGDGGNGTCVQFVSSDSCPNCGQWVDAWKCHTCK